MLRGQIVFDGRDERYQCHPASEAEAPQQKCLEWSVLVER